MNINLGIMPPLEKRIRNKDEKKRLVAREGNKGYQHVERGICRGSLTAFQNI